MDIDALRALWGDGDFCRPVPMREVRPINYVSALGWHETLGRLDKLVRGIWAEGLGMRLVLGPANLTAGRDPYDATQYRTGTFKAIACAHEVEIRLETGERLVTKSRNGWTGYVIDLSA